VVDLMWGELAAWIVAVELAEHIDEPDAKMAVTSQVFDEARHVGFGVLYLPEELEKYSVLKLKRVRNTTWGVGDLFGAAQLRHTEHCQRLGCEPRDLIRNADKMLFELQQEIGPIPGTDLKFFTTNPVNDPNYEKALDIIAPAKDQATTFWSRRARNLIDFGAHIM
jgi:hypothetical protein